MPIGPGPYRDHRTDLRIVFRDLCPDADLMTKFCRIKVIDNLEPDIFLLELINGGKVLEMV